MTAEGAFLLCLFSFFYETPPHPKHPTPPLLGFFSSVWLFCDVTETIISNSPLMLWLVMIVTAFASTSNVLAFPLVSPGVKYEFYCRLIIILKTLLPDRLLRVSVEDMLFRLTHWLQRLLVSQSNAYTTFWLMLWLLTVIVSWLYWNNSIQVVWKKCLHLHYILVRPFTLFIHSELIIVELELRPPSVIKDQDLVLISNISYLHMACYSWCLDHEFSKCFHIAGKTEYVYARVKETARLALEVLHLIFL